MLVENDSESLQKQCFLLEIDLTFSHLALSDEMKETALVERIVLFLGFVVPQISLLNGHRCAA